MQVRNATRTEPSWKLMGPSSSHFLLMTFLTARFRDSSSTFLLSSSSSSSTFLCFFPFPQPERSGVKIRTRNLKNEESKEIFSCMEIPGSIFAARSRQRSGRWSRSARRTRSNCWRSEGGLRTAPGTRSGSRWAGFRPAFRFRRRWRSSRLPWPAWLGDSGASSFPPSSPDFAPLPLPCLLPQTKRKSCPKSLRPKKMSCFVRPYCSGQNPLASSVF